MRDPGTPRRNPFFERASDASADDLGMGWRASAGESDDSGADPDGSDHAGSDPGVADSAAGGFATLVALVEGLSEAQPDAAEHLVAAAHEVVLTVKVLVDATEAVLAQQRAAMAERSAMARDAAAAAPGESNDTSVAWLHPDGGS